MQEQNKQEIGRLMGMFHDTADQMQAKKEQERKELEEFETKFKSLKEQIIWPSIVEIGNELTHYGHDYHVSEDYGYLDAIAAYHPSSITFSIFPSFLEPAFRKKDSAPYISFLADSYNRKVSIQLSTMMANQGGSIGSIDEIDIDSITKESVESKIIEVMKNALMIKD